MNQNYNQQERKWLELVNEEIVNTYTDDQLRRHSLFIGYKKGNKKTLFSGDQMPMDEAISEESDDANVSDDDRGGNKNKKAGHLRSMVKRSQVQ